MNPTFKSLDTGSRDQVVLRVVQEHGPDSRCTLRIIASSVRAHHGYAGDGIHQLDRLVDGCLQRLRRAGSIVYRKGRWSVTP